LRCVLATNVLVSALLLTGSKPRKSLDLVLRKGNVLLSFATLAELHEVLGRKQLRRYFDEEDIRIFIAAVTREAQWIDVAVQIRVCRERRCRLPSLRERGSSRA